MILKVGDKVALPSGQRGYLEARLAGGRGRLDRGQLAVSHGLQVISQNKKGPYHVQKLLERRNIRVLGVFARQDQLEIAVTDLDGNVQLAPLSTPPRNAQEIASNLKNALHGHDLLAHDLPE